MTTLNETLLKSLILDNFQFITSLRKKIFLYIQFLAKKFRNVFPSVDQIAKTCGCGTATVKRALKYFSEVGWLSKIRRCYRSSIYKIPEEILDLDLTKNRTFKKPSSTSVNDPMSDPIYNVAKSESISLRKEQVPVEVAKAPTSEDDGFEKIKKNRAAWNYIKNRYCPSVPVEIDDKSLASLVKNFIVGKPQAIIINALESLQTASITIDKPVGWLFKVCSNIKNRFRR